MVDESRPSKSANAQIPGHVVQSGSEMVIELDPDGSLDPALGVAKRIPESGRLRVEVEAMPVFHLMLIPFIWSADPDYSIVGLVKAVAAAPENHEILWRVRTQLPLAEVDVTDPEPVQITGNSAYALLNQSEAIRVMEGGTGHYMGTMPDAVDEVGEVGIALRPSR